MNPKTKQTLKHILGAVILLWGIGSLITYLLFYASFDTTYWVESIAGLAGSFFVFGLFIAVGWYLFRS